MTKQFFENEIKKMIDDGKCDVDVNGCICYTFKRTVAVHLNCFAVLNCDKIEFDNVVTKIVSLYRHNVYIGLVNVYIGLVNVKDVKNIYCL